MSRKNFVVILLSVLLFGACSESKETPFSQFGISFTCPAGWIVSDSQEYGDGVGCYIAVEKEGISSSGILTIATAELDDSGDLSTSLSSYQDFIKGQSLYSALKFEGEKETDYGKYKGLSAKYTANIMGLPHEGRMFVFAVDDKVYCVTEQEATEDKKKNEAGFKTLKESLSIE
jgi:hypothetical protein